MSGAGRAKSGREALRAAGIELDLRSRRATYREHRASLTRTESLVLAALMRDPSAVLTREELIRAAWPPFRPISARAVDVNVARLRQKLETTAGASPIRSVNGVGYGLKASGEADAPERTDLHRAIDSLPQRDLDLVRVYVHNLLHR